MHPNDVLQANQPLLTVYILRDELKRLWFYRRPACAQKAWEHWCVQARPDSGPGVVRPALADLLARHRRAMPASAEHERR